MKMFCGFIMVLVLSSTPAMRADTVEFFTSASSFGSGNDSADWQSFPVIIQTDTYLQASGYSNLGLPITLNEYGNIGEAVTMQFVFAQPVGGVGLTLYPGPIPSPPCQDGVCPTVWIEAYMSNGSHETFQFRYYNNGGQFLGVEDHTGANIVALWASAYATDEFPYLF